MKLHESQFQGLWGPYFMKLKTIFIRAIAVSFITMMIGFIANCAQPVSFQQTAASLGSTASSTGTPSQYTTTTQSFSFGSGQTSGAVDILIVDDNSGSMQADEQHLATGFNNFISDLAGVDWQIAVTTTDVCADTDYACRGGSATFPPARGRLIGPADSASTTPFGTQYIMKPSTPNVATVFADTINRVTTSGQFLIGSGDERAIYAANLTIAGNNDPSVAQGLFRANAGLAILILSNEDERSCGNDPTCHNDPTNAPQYQPFAPDDYPQSLITSIKTTFGATKNFAVHSLIVKPGDTSCFGMESANAGDYGDTYATLTQMTGGILASLCDYGTGQYTQELSAISQSIRNTSQPVINLDHVPAEEPAITFNPPSNVTFTWAPGSDQLVLSSYPANTSVNVTYKYEN